MANSSMSLDVDPNLGRELITELIGWFEKLLETDTVLPKVFTGVNSDGKQFIILMADLGLQSSEHLDFMRFVLHKEKSVAFAYKMKNAIEVCIEPQIIQEQHTFYSGQIGKYIAVDITSQAQDSWSEGIKIIRKSATEEPEIFFQDLFLQPYKPSLFDEKYSTIWDQIRNQVQWRERSLKVGNVESPIDFVNDVLSKVIAFPFHDKHLFNSELRQRLKIQDVPSEVKFRVVCLSFVLFLSKRAFREALQIKFLSSFENFEAFTKLVLYADDVATKLIEEQLKLSEWPGFVDLQYLQRWDRRFHQSAADPLSQNLKFSVLKMALSHATFSYEDENSVLASDDLMFNELSNIYDAYVTGLRNMFGDHCLN